MQPAVRWSAALAAALLGAQGLQIAGAVLPALLPALVGGVGTVLLEVALHRRLARALPRQVELLRSALHPRLLLGQVLVLVHVLRAHDLSPGAEQVVVLAVVAHELVRLALRVLQVADARLRPQRAELRGLPVDMPAVPARPSLLGEPGLIAVALAGVLLPASLAWIAVGGSSALVAPAAVAGALTATAVVAGPVVSVLRLVRSPRGGAQLSKVNEAVQRHAPQVVLYSSGGPSDIHWLTPWLDVLADLGRPAIIMLRQPGTLPLVPPCAVPVVCLLEGGDVLPFRMPTAQVALFVNNGPENVRLLRNPRLRSAFVGHGDSDKSSSANPTTKMYDEVWVAGPAARQRYLEADVGVLPERIRVIGRPQGGRIDAMPEGSMDWPCTVLYAPTWEGVVGDPYESSVLHTGRDVVRVLLGLSGVRVIFRPHPATGRHDARAARAVRDIARLLEHAGPQHETVAGGGVDLYVLFNRSDALVADVSGVVTDFLSSEKPYFVVNGRGRPDDEYRRNNPSTSAACLVGPGAACLEQGLRDAAGPDTLRPARRALREHLLGPRTADPVQGFRDAVAALCSRERSQT